jgi:uncharacterized protein YdaU (DUF1376 family)
VIFFTLYTERWLAATQGMTTTEEAVYLRLVLWMYINEAELPLDEDECCRIARTETKADRDAVSRVLSRKFEVTPTGQTQQKTAIEIDKFKRGTPHRENRREIETARKRKARDEQRRLYADARAKGLAVSAGMKLSELRELLGLGQVVPLRPVSRPAGQGAGTCPAVPNVYESMNHMAYQGNTLGTLAGQNGTGFEVGFETKSGGNRGAGDGPLDPVPTAPQADPDRVAAAVRALRAGGMQGINAGHPLLHALVAAGASPDAFTYAAAHAVGRGKPFAYALAVVQGQMQDAAQAQAQGLAAPKRENTVAQWAPSIASTT